MSHLSGDLFQWLRWRKRSWNCKLRIIEKRNEKDWKLTEKKVGSLGDIVVTFSRKPLEEKKRAFSNWSRL
jgi:hypothetical protein